MRSLINCIFALTLFLPSQSFAKDGACENIPDLKGYDLTGCQCGNAIAQLPIIPPDNMSLIAACNFGHYKVERGWSYLTGGFYFKGETVISGKLSRQYNNPAFGDYIEVVSDKKIKYSQFRSAVNSMKFKEDPVVIKTFNAPLPANPQCWSAQIKIRVNLLYVLAGHGTDEEGTFPKKFEILNIGKPNPCAP